jgi:hypothetical protein
LKQVFSFVFPFHFPPSLPLKHEFFKGFYFCLGSMWKKQEEAMVEEEWWRLSCKGWITHVSHSICPPFGGGGGKKNINSHFLLFYGYKTYKKKWWHHHCQFFLVLFLVFFQFLAINGALSSPHFNFVLLLPNEFKVPSHITFFSWFFIVIIEGALKSLPFSFQLPLLLLPKDLFKDLALFLFPKLFVFFFFFQLFVIGGVQSSPFLNFFNDMLLRELFFLVKTHLILPRKKKERKN